MSQFRYTGFSLEILRGASPWDTAWKAYRSEHLLRTPSIGLT